MEAQIYFNTFKSKEDKYAQIKRLIEGLLKENINFDLKKIVELGNNIEEMTAIGKEIIENYINNNKTKEVLDLVITNSNTELKTALYNHAVSLYTHQNNINAGTELINAFKTSSEATKVSGHDTHRHFKPASTLAAKTNEQLQPTANLSTYR